MDLKKQLKEKKEEQKKTIEQYNQLQKVLNELAQKLLKIEGGIETLEKLINNK